MADAAGLADHQIRCRKDRVECSLVVLETAVVMCEVPPRPLYDVPIVGHIPIAASDTKDRLCFQVKGNWSFLDGIVRMHLRRHRCVRFESLSQ